MARHSLGGRARLDRLRLDWCRLKFVSSFLEPQTLASQRSYTPPYLIEKATALRSYAIAFLGQVMPYGTSPQESGTRTLNL